MRGGTREKSSLCACAGRLRARRAGDALADDTLGDVIHVGDGKVAVPTSGPVVPTTNRAAARRRQGSNRREPADRHDEDLAADRLHHGRPRLRGVHAPGRRRKGRDLDLELDRLPGRRLPQRRRPERDQRRSVRPTSRVNSTGTCIRSCQPRTARPPRRDGTGGLLEQLGIVPPGYYAGPGDKVVTLVANFKDENYTDIEFPSYVAGYHSGDINGFVNRNVMSVDSYDWVHRTGANPPNEPSTDLCSNRRRAAVQVRGRLRARVRAPARVLGEPRRAELDRRGPRRLRRHPHRVRLPGPLDLRDRLRGPHPDVPRLEGAADAGEPDPTAQGRRRELAHALGRPGWARDAGRLRRRVDVHGVHRRPVRRAVHDRPAQRGREGDQGLPGRPRQVPDG